MSQFDIGAGGPNGRERKLGITAPGVPSGPGVGIATPGLAVQPAVSEGVTLAAQLANALNAAGEAGTATGFYVRDTRHTERANSDMLKALDHGHAAEMAGEDAPDLVQKIQNGDIKAANGADLNETAHAIAAPKVAGLPPEVQDAYHKIIDPHLAVALRTRQKQDQKTAAEDSHNLLTSAAQATSDPAKLQNLVTQGAAFKDVLGINDDENAWKILGPAAEAAAERGDKSKLDVIKGLFGDRFGDKQASLDNTLRTAQDQQTHRAELDATRTIDGMILDQPIAVTKNAVEQQRKALNDAYPGQNRGDAWALPHISRLDSLDRAAATQTKANEAEQQRQVVLDKENQVSSLILQGDSEGAIRKIGELSKGVPNGESWALSQLARVSEWDKKGDAENERLIEQQFRKQAVQSAADSLKNGGTVFSLPAEGVTFERPHGKQPLKITHEDLVRGAVNANFAAIEDRAAKQLDDVRNGEGGDSPEYVQAKTAEIQADVFRQKAKFVTDNAAPWPDMTQMLNSGAALANLESLSRIDPKTGKGVVDPVTSAGYRSWRMLAGNGALQQRLTTDPKARLFYEITDLSMNNVENGDLGKAMYDAYVSLSDPEAWKGTLSDRIDKKKLEAASSGIVGTVGNQEYVNSQVHALAQLAMGPRFRNGEEEALKWASERVKEHTVKLNGFAVPRAGAPVPESMPAAVEQITTQWVAANPKEGYEAKDLTMRPSPNQTWTLCDGAGRAVDTHPFTTGEIYKAYLLGTRKRADDKAAGLKAYQQNPMGNYLGGS